MSDDERRGGPSPGRSPKPPESARTRDPRRSGRGHVSTERLANLDETLGFEPVEGEARPAPPPLPKAESTPGLDRRPPAAHRVAAAGKRATDLGLGGLKRRDDEVPSDPHADSTAVGLRARDAGAERPSDEPTHAGQDGELPSVLLSSGLVRAGDVLDPEDGTGTQTDHRRDLALEERVAAAKAARDRPPLSERRDVDAALVRPKLHREGASDPGRVQVRGRGLTRRPGRPEGLGGRPEGPGGASRGPSGPARTGRAGVRPDRRSDGPVRAGVRREPTGPRVGRYTIGEHPEEKTVANADALTGRGPHKAGVRRGPVERSGRVVAASARLQREPTDPSRATLPFEPEPSGRPRVTPAARRQREPTDPGGRPVVAPLTRAQREPTDPSQPAVPRYSRRSRPGPGTRPPSPRVQGEPTDPGTRPPPRVQREPTDPGVAAPSPQAQREPTDPGGARSAREPSGPVAAPPRAQREPTGSGAVPPRARREASGPAVPPPRAQREPTGPGALSGLTNPELVPGALQREPTDPGSAVPPPLTASQREPTDPGLPSSALIVAEGTDVTGRPAMTPPPMMLAEQLAHLESGRPGPGAPREGGVKPRSAGPPTKPKQRFATVPAGAAGAGSLDESRQKEATESSTSAVQREGTVPVGAARAGGLAEHLRERLARRSAAPESQREPTTPHGAARKGALKRGSRSPGDAPGGVQQEPTAPKGAARAGGLRATPQEEATETAASARQQEATETAASPRQQETTETGALAADVDAARTPQPPASTAEEATATGAEPVAEPPPEPPRRNTAPLGSSSGGAVVSSKQRRADAPLHREAPSRPEDVPPRLAHHTVTGVLSADERAGLMPSAERRDPFGVFKTLSIVSMVLLFEAIALPTSRGAPWSLLGDPGGVTFVALAFLLLVIVAHILPVKPLVRAGAALGVGVLMTGFSLVVAGAAARADLFDGQPAVAAVMGGPVGGRVAMSLALMVLPFGLLWRYLEPRRLGPRITHGVGLGLVLLLAFGASALGLGGGAAVTSAFDTLGTAPVFGDRMVAAFGLMPLLVALVSLMGFLPGGRGRRLPVFAVIFWVALLIPLIVAALFVAKSEAWMAVLEPIKVASFVAVPLLYLPAATAAFVVTLRGRKDA